MFLPRQSKIFDSLLRHSEFFVEAAGTFQNISRDQRGMQKSCEEMARLELEGDNMVREVSNEVERTFILPLDKEDIMELVESIDDILDNLEDAASWLNIYGIREKDRTTMEFADLIMQCAEQIHQGLLLIKAHKFKTQEFMECRRKIDELEALGDGVYRRALARLLGGNGARKVSPADVLSIIKWKEIYQVLEDTLDLCEHISVLFDRLRIKYG